MVGKKEDKVGGGDDSAVPECGVFILFFACFCFLCFSKTVLALKGVLLRL